MNNKLILGDTLESLRDIPSQSVDIGVTSPPYNLGGDFHSSSKNGGGRRSYGGYDSFEDNLPEPEYQESQVEVLKELHRIIKPSGWLFYNHKNRIKDGQIISPIGWLERTPWIIYQDIVIDCRGSTNNDKRRFFPSHEFIFVLSARKGNKLFNKNCLTSIWSFPQINRKETKHPAAFHENLPLICLEASAFPGAVVIDPYMGRGTTGIAAKKLGLSFIGIEIIKEYFDLAEENIRGSKPILSMFPSL